MQLLDEIYINKVCDNMFLESKMDRYMLMFNRGPYNEDVIKSIVQQAVTIFKKDDRISYFLNWYRLYYTWKYLCQQYLLQFVDTPEIFATQETQDRLRAMGWLTTAETYMNEWHTLAKKTRKNPEEITTELKDKFRPMHFLSRMKEILELPLPEIQAKVWDLNILPSTLLSEFNAVYGQYDELFQYSVSAAPTDTPVIKFPDGYTWFDIHSHITLGGKDGKEAVLAQHCGNDYDRHIRNEKLPEDMFKHVDDRVYLLREPAHQGKIQRWKPVVTAVLNGGTLIEMKGKQNTKPDSKYHQYIVPFVKSDIVQQINARFSHQPQKSFSLSDLPETTKQEILQLKGEDFEIDPISPEQRAAEARADVEFALNDIISEPILHHCRLLYNTNTPDNTVVIYARITYRFVNLEILKSLVNRENLGPQMISNVQQDVTMLDFNNHYMDIDASGCYLFTTSITATYETAVNVMNRLKDVLINFDASDEYKKGYEQVVKYLVDNGYAKVSKYKEIMTYIKSDKLQRMQIMDSVAGYIVINFQMRTATSLTEKDRIKLQKYLNSLTFNKFLSQQVQLTHKESEIEYGHIFDEAEVYQSASMRAAVILITIQLRIYNIRKWKDTQLDMFMKIIKYIRNNYTKVNRSIADVASKLTGTRIYVKP